MTPAPPALPPEPRFIALLRTHADGLKQPGIDTLAYIDALRAVASGLVEENQRLKQMLFDADQRAADNVSAAQAARERVAELSAALVKYGHHGTIEKVCAHMKHQEWECDCGFAEVPAALAPSSETTKAL